MALFYLYQMNWVISYNGCHGDSTINTVLGNILIIIYYYQARTQGRVWGDTKTPNSQKYTKKVHSLTNVDQQVHLLCKLHIIWPVDRNENHENGCHQRSDFMAKMHQNRFWLGLHSPRLTPSWI